MNRSYNPLRATYSVLSRLYLHSQRHLRTLNYLLRPGVTLLDGADKYTGETIRICYAGFIPQGSRIGFPSQVLTSITNETHLGRQWLWRMQSTAAKNDCSFLLMESPTERISTIGRLLSRNRPPFFIPFSIRTFVNIDDIQALLQKNEDLRKDLKRLKSEEFQAEISRNPKDYQSFLETHYQPYAKSNFGFWATYSDYSFLCYENNIAEQFWELIKVMKNGEWLAGQLMRKSSACADAMEMGVRDGDRSLVKRGTLAAAYWFFVQRARELGYSEVSFMLSHAFPRNGVLQFKSKYRPRLVAVPFPTHGFLLVPLNSTVLTQRILLEHPFFEISKGRLTVTAFARDKKEVEQVEKAVRKDIRRFSGDLPIEVVTLDEAIPSAREND